MATTDFKSVDDYLASQPENVRGILERVRGIIRGALPGAAEVISYQIPTYKLDGKAVIYFAGWKEHYSLYPVNDRVKAAFEGEIAQYKLGKGTIRFPLFDPIPAKLIERIARFLAEEASETGRPGKAAGSVKRSRAAK